MANKIVWIFGVLCVIGEIQALWNSLPSLVEVKSRRRWCLGEGARCPVNLPFKFSPCCKPYVCTVIPKPRKSNVLLMFKDYKDHRCMVPNLDGPHNYTHAGENPPDNDRLTPQKATLQSDVNEFHGTLSQLNSSLYKDESLDASKEKHSESNDIYSDTVESNCSQSLEKSNSHSYSEDSSSLNISDNYTNNTNIKMSSYLFKPTSSKNSDKKSEMSTSLIRYNKHPGRDKKITNNYTKPSDVHEGGINHSSFKRGPINSYYINRTSVNTTVVSNSSEEVEDEWTSSLMDYDTRPGLHKIVTIQPLHLFHNVETIKLNESIETSD